jgi:hypothetical protein
MIAKKVGKLGCRILQKNGEKLIVRLENVKFVLELWIYLFSIRKALKNGFNLSNDGEIITLSKENVNFTFNKLVRMKNGFIPGIILLQDWVMLGLQSWKLRNVRQLMSKMCIKFLIIVVKLMLGLLEKHMVLKLPASLMSVKFVQLEKQGRKASTKNGKEEV